MAGGIGFSDWLGVPVQFSLTLAQECFAERRGVD